MPAALSSNCCLLLLKNWFAVFIAFTMPIPLCFTLQVWIHALCFAGLIAFRVLDRRSFRNLHSQKCHVLLFILLAVTVILDKRNLLNDFIAVQFQHYDYNEFKKYGKALFSLWKQNHRAWQPKKPIPYFLLDFGKSWSI